MAKKETTKGSATTVASKAAEKIAADVLKHNPDINEVHVTSEGKPIYTRNDAQNHANTLQNREVYSTKRGAAAKATAKPKGNSPEGESAPANGEQEIDELTGEPINDNPEKAEA